MAIIKNMVNVFRPEGNDTLLDSQNKAGIERKAVMATNSLKDLLGQVDLNNFISLIPTF